MLQQINLADHLSQEQPGVNFSEKTVKFAYSKALAQGGAIFWLFFELCRYKTILGTRFDVIETVLKETNVSLSHFDSLRFWLPTNSSRL